MGPNSLLYQPKQKFQKNANQIVTLVTLNEPEKTNLMENQISKPTKILHQVSRLDPISSAFNNLDPTQNRKVINFVQKTKKITKYEEHRKKGNKLIPTHKFLQMETTKFKKKKIE